MMNSMIVAESEKCIGCRTCEIACAVGHGDGYIAPDVFSPRLRVIRGMKVTVPVMCHQCDNAPCANACPTGAIVWSNNSIQVEQEHCIGCKSCAIACPFGAMTVISEEDDLAAGLELPRESQAIKCDLCVDSADGPACVRVCPTNALRLVDSGELNKQILEKQRRSALKTLVSPAA